jgi:ATP-dependent helicase/DNAse subunit B
MDGMLDAADLETLIPGVTADLPISPSALGVLLGCPHQFLSANLLGFRDPSTDVPQREIGQPHYGNLFHSAAAGFSARHGEAFCARQDTIADWRSRADAISDSFFDEFVKGYPLVGDAVREQQRQRLRRDLRESIEYEWRNPKTRRFVAAERTFGRPAPIELALPGGSLFVRGQIDRLDVEGGTTIVTDFKTGSAHPRTGTEEGPNTGLDLQIALYGMVTKHLATKWGVPGRVAATYLYVGKSAASERAFPPDDFDDALEPAARDWLDVARGLLSDRTFPRTPIADDCVFCRFRPVCGDAVYERAATLLMEGTGAVAAFGRMKTPPEEEEE